MAAIPSDLLEPASEILSKNRCALIYDVETFSETVRDSIALLPEAVRKGFAEIILLYRKNSPGREPAKEDRRVSVFKVRPDAGYGERRKLIFYYARQRFDYLLIVNGETPLPPEMILTLLAHLKDSPDALFVLPSSGKKEKPYDCKTPETSKPSRFSRRKMRFSAGLARFLGGTRYDLTFPLCSILKVETLHVLPFQYNDDSEAFELELAIQMQMVEAHTEKFPVSKSFYVSHPPRVSLWRLYYRIFRSLCKIRFMRYEIFFDPRFHIVPLHLDVKEKYRLRYIPKRAGTSIHGTILRHDFGEKRKIIDIGGGCGEAVACPLAQKGHAVTVIDLIVDPKSPCTRQYHVDLNEPWASQFPAEKYDVALALDILEHLKSPENAVRQIRDMLPPDAELFASTGNIGYFITRFMLLFGFFNYGRRGILDMTHMRLFTAASFQRLFYNEGFQIVEICGFGPPIADISTHSRLLRFADFVSSLAARIYPPLFAYQILVVARRKAPLDNLEERKEQDAS